MLIFKTTIPGVPYLRGESGKVWDLSLSLSFMVLMWPEESRESCKISLSLVVLKGPAGSMGGAQATNKVPLFEP